MLLQGKARGCASDVGVQPHEVEAVLGNVPPQATISDHQVTAVQWFNMRWLDAHMQGTGC